MSDHGGTEPAPERLDSAAGEVLERFSEGVLGIDAAGKLVFVNRGAEQILGRPASELLDRKVWEALPQARRTRVFRRYLEAMSRQRVVRFEHVFAAPDRPLEVRIYPSRTGASVLLAEVPQDVDPGAGLRTPREWERLLAEERAAREEAEREAELREEVIGIVSHDLRNPLNSILLNAELLLDGRGREEERRERLMRVVSATERMKRLIDGLLDTQRLGAGYHLAAEFERVDTLYLLREACALFAAQAEVRGVRLAYEAAPDVPAVQADEGRILQVLWNLIGNAIRFTPAGETVTVRARSTGEKVCFSVSDRGPGIPESDLPHLFDPYWQDKRTARLGAGLGLPISRALVEAHGGTLAVESSPGAGTTFSFAIPRAPRP